METGLEAEEHIDRILESASKWRRIFADGLGCLYHLWVTEIIVFFFW